MEKTFKSVFGQTWEKLPPVFQKRYINRSFSDDVCSVEGEMDIGFSRIMLLLIPFFRLFHVLVPFKGNHIPVKVDFRSKTDSDAVYLERKFFFPGKKPYLFNSRMQPINFNEVIEIMSLGIGWRTHYFYDGEKIVMEHKGYAWRIFGFNVPLRLEFLIGRGYATEEIIDDNSYRVTMTMTHRLFGTLYSYTGNFTFTSLPT